MDIHALGYLRVEATDLDAWERFLRDGLDVEVRRDGDAELRARLDERAARLVVTAADIDRLASVGWEASGLRGLDRLGTVLGDAGVEVRPATPEELADRRVEALLHVCDPNGTRLELYAGPALDHRPLTTAGTSFVAGDLGLGHVVLPQPDMASAMDFYGGLLGFHLRDSMRLPGMGADGADAWIRFLGCNPRHHSLALFQGPVPSGIVHLMLEVEDLDAVGRALDRVRELEAPLSATLGRHTNDHMVSFYVGTPGGFDLEYGTGGRLVDPDSWVATEITAVSYWGHRWGGAG